MVQPNQLKDASLKAVRRTTVTIEQTLREIPDSVVSTARIIISAEERLRQRLRSILRVTLATLFLGLSSLISLGATATMAFAKKVSPETTREKRTKGHLRNRYHLRHSGKTVGTTEVTAHLGRATRSSLGLKHHHLSGIASWYGKGFDHRRTASGVRFNTHRMMAAHRTLPFGTKVRVTNVKNHRSCIVEITDRGPYVGNRVIDLSYVAAEQIGMTQTGTAEVKLEVLNPESILPDIATGPNSELERSGDRNPVFDGIPSFPHHSYASILSEPSLAAGDDGR